tara:strand:+ start:5924 stop:6118 length:195 start_codon:yes stop_codon:yes gene_type:complete
MISPRAFTGATPNAAKLISDPLSRYMYSREPVTMDQRSALGQTKQDNAKIPRDDPQMRGLSPLI